MNYADLLNMFFVGTDIKPAGRNAHATKRGPGRRPQSRPVKNASHNDARAAGVPKSLRQYAKRYGGLDVHAIKQIDRQMKGHLA